jgi:alcohol dehydrogenase (cytochrome c)
MVLDSCDIYLLNAEKFIPGQTYYATGTKHSPSDVSRKLLFAYSLDADKTIWKYPQIGSAQSSGGTMTTAGGLVFFGDDNRSFEAVDARSGVSLWHFNTGQDIHASPMSYAVNGNQYVAIAAGGDVFSFSLHQ